MNVLVERYDTALKQTMGELGASIRLSKTRLGAIEQLKAERERVKAKTLEEKEVLRAKFEELEAALKEDRAAKKVLAREKTSLEQANAALEKEKAQLQEERDAVTRKLIEERRRLRDSRGQEVTRERVRVQSAMTDKFSRGIDRVRTYLAKRELAEREKNLLGQASGTRKCLEMIREAKLEITQELVEVFIQQEAEHADKVARLDVGSLPEEDLALSPLILPSRFVNEEFMASLDPYGSNEELVGSETASLLRTPSGTEIVLASPRQEESDSPLGEEAINKGDATVVDLENVPDPSQVEGEEKEDAAGLPASSPIETEEPLQEKLPSPGLDGLAEPRGVERGEKQVESTGAEEGLPTTQEVNEFADEQEVDSPISA
ncbi:hypothetical protein Bca101_012314 [Brassica carinata]